jgi:phosphate transport system permease protein
MELLATRAWRILAPPWAAAWRRRRRATPVSPGELWARRLFTLAGLTAVGVMVLIVLFLLREGLGLFASWPLKRFLLGRWWYPTYDPPDFGALPQVAGSLAVTFVSAALAVPLGLGCALYLCEVAGPRTREWLKPAVELMSGIPSVVLGFVGMVVVAPRLQAWLELPSGLNLFTASLMLAVMAVPTITSLAEDALQAVPQELSEASLALGATRWETLVRVRIPAAAAGLGTAVILGMSRAMGETMVVLMVAGGAALIPTSLFDPVRSLPATIAAEMGEAPVGSQHYLALFALGLVLFLLTLGFSLLAAWLGRRFRQRGEASL